MQPEVPGTTIPIDQIAPDGTPLCAFVPASAPPVAYHAAQYDCSFTQTQFEKLAKYAGTIPDTAQHVAKLAGTLEASASCDIEGIVARHSAVLQALATGQRPKGSASQVIDCYRANQEAVACAKSIPADQPWAELTLRTAHRTLHHHDPEWRFITAPGEWRIQQNYISNRRAIIYIPPPHWEVPRLMAALDHWMQSEQFSQLPLAMRLALSHYQVEAIHPFPDGNGRAGRALNSALAAKHLGADVAAPWSLSTLISADRSDYYQALRDPRKTGRWDRLIGFFENCLANDAMRWQAVLKDIHDLAQAWQNEPRLSQRAKQVSMTLLANPYVTVARVRREAGLSAAAATIALSELRENRIIEEVHTSRPGKLYRSPAVAETARINTADPP